MKLYKVTAYVRVLTHRSNKWGHLLEKETVIVDNLEWANIKFEEFLNQVKFDIQLTRKGKTIYAKCELFIPHVHDHGELAYWGKDEDYIRQFHYNTSDTQMVDEHGKKVHTEEVGV